MIKLDISAEQLDGLYREMIENDNLRIRKRCFALYLKGHNCRHREIVRIVRIDESSLTDWLKQYRNGGLAELISDNYRKPAGQLDAHAQKLKSLFEKRPPHTVNQAIRMIKLETGVNIKPSACRTFLKKSGFKPRRCGLVPGKAATDEKHQQKQREFHDNTLQPLLTEAKENKRVVLFVDAAHFVMGAFLGMLWCLVRQFLPSGSGRQRYNVLGAYDPIRREVLTLTNSTVINREAFCLLLEKIADVYRKCGLPVTLVLDNARYQKCASVFEKAEELQIELLYLPACSPNLNLIERLWRFVKKEVLYSTHYDNFAKFKESIDSCLLGINNKFQQKMKSLMTLNFQLF